MEEEAGTNEGGEWERRRGRRRDVKDKTSEGSPYRYTPRPSLAKPSKTACRVGKQSVRRSGCAKGKRRRTGGMLFAELTAVSAG